MKYCTTLLLSLLICGCHVMTPAELKQDEKEKAKTEIQEVFDSCKLFADEYSKEKSAILDKYFWALKSPQSFARFIAVKENGLPQYGILIVYSESDWAFLNSAYEKGGAPLRTNEMDRQVRPGGSIRESLSIKLETKELPRYKKDGLNFKVSGLRGDVIFELPAIAFQAIEKCVEKQNI